MTVAERLWAKVDVRGPDDCWPWTGSRHRQGYGEIHVGGKLVLAHRVVSELTEGPIPSGALVRHSCDNPPCCNPAHLLRGDHGDNLRDAYERGRRGASTPPPARGGAANGNAKLADADVAIIREALAAGESQRRVAMALGVSRSCVKHIADGRNWRQAA